MSNFRIEHARIRLSEPIEGFDPNAGIDSAELCWIDATKIDANTCGVSPLSEFYAADFRNWQEDEKWFAATEGLATVRKLLAHYERIVKDGIDPLGRNLETIAKKIVLLDRVITVLQIADQNGVLFCFAVSD